MASTVLPAVAAAAARPVRTVVKPYTTTVRSNPQLLLQPLHVQPSSVRRTRPGVPCVLIHLLGFVCAAARVARAALCMPWPSTRTAG